MVEFHRISGLFVLHTTNHAEVAVTHVINIHSYADDTQLYNVPAKQGHDDGYLATLKLHIRREPLVAANRLKLNADKTEPLWACSSKSGSCAQH